MIIEFFIFLYHVAKEMIRNPSLNHEERLKTVVKELALKENKKTLDLERKSHNSEEDLALIGLIAQELQIHIEKKYLPLFAIIVNTVDKNQDILLYRYTITENTKLSLFTITKETEDYIKSPEFSQKINRVLAYQAMFLLDKKIQPIIKNYNFYTTNFKKICYLSIGIEFFPFKDAKLRRFQ
ncbi:hypothetical protein [Fusobacterium necrophorum]|uniref:Uncharacterized protein n=1 Tax=Fusobacterium necrophorum subsp. funduliforme TaxID=143387 RepID=A0A162J6Q9_9FUSO|nr:hypothetical protein [Fusobacterium necrophorum]KYL05236.1 hypothetical protein A2J07_00440 [Fusobacterium necrophorum subsp. funduliforme]MDK4525101.1 hypothetical protein [Fusobacterium necrophorum]